MTNTSQDTSNADNTIQSCISLTTPKSFFLFAGAGSGKTRSLVTALEHAKGSIGEKLKKENRSIAVITYTNAAAEEIKRRNDDYPFFEISTIHSFAWNLIKPFQTDIKAYLIDSLNDEIHELSQKKGKTALEKVIKKTEKLEKVKSVKCFTYNPVGINSTRESLSHGDVIKILAAFLNNPLMQEILISRFPILFIDESQDTNKHIMDAFIEIRKKFASRFMLGLFGDMMQRIYLDGKESLGNEIDDTWATPEKLINYRSPKRIIKLINNVRCSADGIAQEPCSDAVEGIVRVFIADNTVDRNLFEKAVCEKMAEITTDLLWSNEGKDVKTLTLEHKMAAERSGFWDLYNALNISTSLKDSAFQKLSTSDPIPQVKGLAFLTEVILKLVTCRQNNDTFGITSIVKQNSPLMQKDIFEISAENHQYHVEQANIACGTLCKLWDSNADPQIKNIVQSIYETGLFELPGDLMWCIIGDDENPEISPQSIDDNVESTQNINQENRDKRNAAWKEFGNVPFSQVDKYYKYIKGESYFDTHQGVKGLEFPRVMVVLDDESARGNLFSYDKLFGIKSLSKADEDNIKAGKDTTIQRTTRLFYVICSRAEESLAIVMYTANKDILRNNLISSGWFTESEMIIECV